MTLTPSVLEFLSNNAVWCSCEGKTTVRKMSDSHLYNAYWKADDFDCDHKFGDLTTAEWREVMAYERKLRSASSLKLKVAELDEKKQKLEEELNSVRYQQLKLALELAAVAA